MCTVARLRMWPLPAVLAIGAIVLRLCAGPRTIDDAYITFRYVQHIVQGQGFVYNPGEHVLGTTTPLYTLLLALLLALTHLPLPWLGLTVAAIADGCTTIMVYALTARASTSRLAALLAAAMFACTTTSVFYAQSGMETSLF